MMGSSSILLICSWRLPTELTAVSMLLLCMSAVSSWFVTFLTRVLSTNENIMAWRIKLKAKTKNESTRTSPGTKQMRILAAVHMLSQIMTNISETELVNCQQVMYKLVKSYH